MRQRPLPLLGIVIVVLAAAATGCSDGKKNSSEKGAAAEPPATQTTVPVAPSVTVTARDYGFDVPPEIEGGVIRMTLQNNGKLKHEAVIVATGDTPLGRVRQDLTPIVTGEGKPTPDYLRFQGGVSLVPGGTSEMAFLTLPAGNYAVVCTLTDADSLNADAGRPSDAAQRFHYDLGMAVAFTVKKANTATMPPTDGTVVARDWAFEVPPLVPGFKVFTFRNDGQQDHSLGVAEFPDEMDEAAARAAFDAVLAANAAHRRPPDDIPVPEDVAFAGPLSAGAQVTFPMNFKVHRTYVFGCYMSDRTGGPQHAAGKHMVTYATTPNG
jgi:hypothetical protein